MTSLRAGGTRIAVVSASENTQAALVAAGIAGLFVLVVGVDHHDDADGHDYADELRAHGADIVVTDLGTLLRDDAMD